MADLSNYRKIAAEKHKLFLDKKKIEDAEKNKIEMDMLKEYLRISEEEENKKKLEEIINKDENERIDFFNDELDISIINLNESDDLFLSLQLIDSQLETIINLIEKYNRLKEIQEKIIPLVEMLNKIFEYKKNKPPSYVENINEIVHRIFQKAKVDIPIELMDTEKDEEYALKLQEELYKLNI